MTQLRKREHFAGLKDQFGEELRLSVADLVFVFEVEKGIDVDKGCANDVLCCSLAIEVVDLLHARVVGHHHVALRKGAVRFEQQRQRVVNQQLRWRSVVV